MRHLLALLIFLSPLSAINWTDPSLEDFYELENTLQETENSLLDSLIWITPKNKTHTNVHDCYKNFKFSKDGNFDKDINIVSFGDDAGKIAVCSFLSPNWKKRGKDIPYFINARLAQLKKYGFTGDFVYQVGGYPNISEGDLQLFDVPYAFKLAIFRKLRKLGYEKVLWLDGIIELTNSLAPIWKCLDSSDIFLRDSLWGFKRNCTTNVIQSTNLTHRELQKFKHYAANILALNFNRPGVQKLMDDWYEAALLKAPFFSPFPEQIVLSILIQRNHLKINNSLWRSHFTFDYTTLP